jgi:hypothetical protein
VTKTANSAVLAAGLEPQHPQGLGNNDALLGVVRRRDALECLQALHGGVTARSLVGNHATDGSPEHLGGCAEVVRSWVGQLYSQGIGDDAVALDASVKARGTYRREWG